MKELHDPFSIRLRSWRASKGYTQHDVAEILGVRKASISNVETTARGLSMETLTKLAMNGLDVHWLLTGEDRSIQPAKTPESKIGSEIVVPGLGYQEVIEVTTSATGALIRTKNKEAQS